MKKIIAICLFLATSASARELQRAFVTDYCTAWLEGVGQYDWSHCCVEHDLYLWAGGKKEHAKLAHKRLRGCVAEASTQFYGDIMYFGIVLGSFSPIKLPDKKWGNAWGETDSGDKLSEIDIETIENSIFSTDVPVSTVIVDEFLENLKELNL